MVKKIITILLIAVLVSTTIFADTTFKETTRTDGSVSDGSMPQIQVNWTINDEALKSIYHYEFGFSSTAVSDDDIKDDGTLPSLMPHGGVVMLDTKIDNADKYYGTNESVQGKVYASWVIRTNQNVSVSLSAKNLTTSPSDSTGLPWTISWNEGDEQKSLTTNSKDEATTAKINLACITEASPKTIQTKVDSVELTFKTNSIEQKGAGTETTYTGELVMVVTNEDPNIN